VYSREGEKIAVTSKSTLTDVSGCICFAGQIDSNRVPCGQGKLFNDDGKVVEGIIKDNDLIDGRRWELNDDGSYQYYQVTHGEDKLVGQVAKLPGCQK
jgi:hypothetical protein